MTDWEEIFRGQVLTCGEISVRLGKSRPTVLKTLQQAVKDGTLETGKKGSVVFYNIVKKKAPLEERE